MIMKLVVLDDKSKIGFDALEEYISKGRFIEHLKVHTDINFKGTGESKEIVGTYQISINHTM